MDLSIVENVLTCPFCGGQFNRTGTDGASGRMEYGILACYCSHFPVVAGIPVLNRDKATEKAITLVEGGRHLDAVLALIQPNRISIPPIWKLSSFIPLGNRLRRWAHQRRLQEWRERIAALLLRMDQGDRVTVRELLGCYYSSSSNRDHYDYFAFRFGQPRYLAALSFVHLIRHPQAMILDLGCGQGYVTRSLIHRANGQPVIGVDQSFWGLYVAKRWIAPEGEYVCCSADGALPFADKVFSEVFSSDAFHYFVNKRSVVRELNRVTEEGVIILAWVYNGRVRVPYDGVPLPPEGYHALFHHLPHRIVADGDILDRYLRGRGPDLSTQPARGSLDQERVLSIVASTREDVFRDHGSFEEVLHAQGRLGINPLYGIEIVEGEVEKVRLRRKFPSRYYEEEHSEYKKFMPETIELDSTILRDLTSGRRTTAIEKLIDQFIVLGMPERFLDAPHQPISVGEVQKAGPHNA